MDTEKVFPIRLIELRKEKGLTQGELADKIGISRQSVTLYEREARIPDIEVLAKIASYFGVSADYLIGLEDARTHEGADISARTGLSAQAVEVLEFMQKYRDNTENPLAFSVLNEMIEGYVSPISEQHFADLIDADYPLSATEREEYEKYISLCSRCRHDSGILDLLVEMYQFPFWEDEKLIMSPLLGLRELTGGPDRIISTVSKNTEELHEKLDDQLRELEALDGNFISLSLADFADDTIIRKISDALREICRTHRPAVQEQERENWIEAISFAKEWSEEEPEEEEPADAEE